LKKKSPPYTLFDHTADIGFDVSGATRKELFQNAAIALMDCLTNRAGVKESAERPLQIAGADLDDLWVNYLRELLYLFDGQGFLVRTVQILTIGNKHLSAVVKGEPYRETTHEILTEIKAITYHQARAERTPAGWQGRFIVDV